MMLMKFLRDWVRKCHRDIRSKAVVIPLLKWTLLWVLMFIQEHLSREMSSWKLSLERSRGRDQIMEKTQNSHSMQFLQPDPFLQQHPKRWSLMITVIFLVGDTTLIDHFKLWFSKGNIVNCSQPKFPVLESDDMEATIIHFIQSIYANERIFTFATFKMISLKTPTFFYILLRVGTLKRTFKVAKACTQKRERATTPVCNNTRCAIKIIDPRTIKEPPNWNAKRLV